MNKDLIKTNTLAKDNVEDDDRKMPVPSNDGAIFSCRSTEDLFSGHFALLINFDRLRFRCPRQILKRNTALHRILRVRMLRRHRLRELQSPGRARCQHDRAGLVLDEANLQLTVYSTRHHVLQCKVGDGEHATDDGRDGGADDNNGNDRIECDGSPE